ncbi:MAG: gliding motility-associated C-terminal domain-containing protein [Paludibacteraceae bacterium]|nr:gliding motility-associated C-terminal domain-containing protein [Paludibacteraceae bacterium]
MKKPILTILLSLITAVSFAADIIGVGATQVKNGNDTLLFFKDEIHLKADTLVDWYHTDGTLFQSDAQDIYPDDGGYYFVKNSSYQSSPVYAFVYADSVSGLTTAVEADCDVTLLQLQGNTAPFVYTRPDGTQGTYERRCTIQYTTLSWGDNTWQDSTVTMSTTLYAGYYTLPTTLLSATTITLCYDGDLRSALAIPDSICVAHDVKPDDIHAVAMRLTSETVARTDSNEMKRPTGSDIIKVSSTDKWSGPLEVTFRSNPTPAVKYYRWTIYHGTEVWKTRQDIEYHDFFSEPGSYRIVCTVNNQYCTSDSMEMVVAITESDLRVPNTFTPNGDGKNDEFRVAYRSLREYHIWIYNRWGKLVYESSDPAKGWDGMIGNRPASEGAYYYVIRAIGTDADKNAHYMGKISYNNKKTKGDESILGIYQLSGDINLIR